MEKESSRPLLSSAPSLAGGAAHQPAAPQPDWRPFQRSGTRGLSWPSDLDRASLRRRLSTLERSLPESLSQPTPASTSTPVDVARGSHPPFKPRSRAQELPRVPFFPTFSAAAAARARSPLPCSAGRHEPGEKFTAASPRFLGLAFVPCHPWSHLPVCFTQASGRGC